MLKIFRLLDLSDVKHSQNCTTFYVDLLILTVEYEIQSGIWARTGLVIIHYTYHIRKQLLLSAGTRGVCGILHRLRLLLLHLLWLSSGRSHLYHWRSAVRRPVALIMRLEECLLLCGLPWVILDWLPSVNLRLIGATVGIVIQVNLVRLLSLIGSRSILLGYIGLLDHHWVLLLLWLDARVSHLWCTHVYLCIVLLWLSWCAASCISKSSHRLHSNLLWNTSTRLPLLLCFRRLLLALRHCTADL